MKALALTTATILTLVASVAHADCPFDPGASSELADLGTDVNAAAAAVPTPCTATLGDVIASATQTPEGAAFAKALISKLAAEAGKPLTDEQIAGLLASPNSVDDLLVASIPQVVKAAKDVQAASDARGGTPAKAPSYELPQKVDFAQAASMMKPTRSSREHVAGNVMYGDGPSDPSLVSDAQIQQNRALAEMLTRLSLNTGKAAADRFTVTYKGRDYSSVDGLLRALAANGNTVSSHITQRVANFIDLSLDHGDGTFCDVKAAVSIRTNQKDADGNDIVVPATHSGLFVDVKGPDMNATVAWFQGVDGTGFFPEGTSTRQAWVGGKDVEGYQGAQALKSVSAAAMWTSVVNDIVAEKKLPGFGYARTGICDDSVAMVQQLVTGRTTVYPLSMDHDLVGEYLDRKIAEGGPLAHRYQTLRNTMNALPSDVGTDPTQRERIIDSIPYGPGPTPFPSADHARAALAPQS
ncbi:MAG TPA: hypothetical protein VMV18_14840 [bacterium]|nr:hypothetical protein [bacterium]